MPQKCSLGCSPSEAPMHGFPNAEKYPERFRIWVNIVGGKLETQSDFEYYKRKKICDKHFTDKDRNRFRRLNAFAVPSVLTGATPSQVSEEASTSQTFNESLITPIGVRVTSSRPTTTLQTVCGGSTLHQGSEVPEQACTSQTILKGNKQNADAVIMEHNYTAASKYLRKPSIKGASKYIPRYNTRTGKWEPFQKKMIALRSEICRLRKKSSSFRQKLDNAEKISENIAFQHIVRNMTKPAQLFMHMQLQGKKQSKGRRFTVDEKVLALSLFKRSPKSYALLYKYFTLPSVKAMKRLLGQIKLCPGINPIIFEKIKNTVMQKDLRDRLCSLMFDEMSLTPQVSYNTYKDTLEGFASNNEAKFADHALVFMIKGITQSFKQPIAYYFTSSLNKTELKKLIKEVINYAQRSGLIIINTVCDQGTVNVGAISDLVNDTKATYLRLEKEWRHDFFCINGKKIIPIYDAPHLIKGIRNNLINKDMAYTTNNIEKIVKWNYFQMVYAADKSYGELRLLDKITEEHIDPEKINKMKVKSATQLFSHSVAVATEHLTARGDLPNECKALIEVTLLLDNVFDSLNSSTFHIPNGKVYKGPIRRNSAHHELWKRAKCLLKSIKFIKKTVKSNKVRLVETIIPSVTNLVKTIEGMEAIWKVLSQKYGFDALLTRNFNQDPVENFFGNIRSYGARNISPNTVSFEGAFKALLLNNYNINHSKRANCEEEANIDCLENLKFFLTEKITESSDVPKEKISFNHEIILENCEKNDAGQVNYVCGWVLKRLSKNIIKKCKTCKETIIDKNDENKDNKFIKAKEYSKKKWLVYPNKLMTDCFHDLQNLVTGFLKNNVQKKNLKTNIILLADVLLDIPFKCVLHKDALKQKFFDLTINVLVHSWCRSLNRILSGKITYVGDDDQLKTAAQMYHNKFKHYKNRK